MADSDDEREKQALLQAVAETKQLAPKLIEKGRNLTEAGQSALDWAESVERLAAKAPPGFFSHPMFTDVSNGFRAFNSMGQKQYAQITDDDNLLRVMHATQTSTAVSTSAAAFTWFVALPAAMPELRSMEMLLHRSVDVSKLRELMRTLLLDVERGDMRSPVQLLSTAEEALRRPFADQGYATAVLVPLRESIQGCVDELLKLRPTAEKAGGWVNKVSSIAQYCGKIAVSSDHVSRVATTTHALINQLSAAKDRQMDRDRIVSLFDQGVSLLQDIVLLVDQDKLRSIGK